jgi:hypothetical protein
MRMTTGLLLTAALLIPGTARAQTGIPGMYDLPQVPPSVTLPPSAALPPHFVQDIIKHELEVKIHKHELEVEQEIKGIATFAPIGLAILAMLIETLCRRRGGKDDAAR